MKLSVVILNYNVRYFLEQCIRSVQKAIRNLDAEIIVVDNASDDDSCRMVRELFPDLKLIENKENVGFSKANNQAVAIAEGEYICILNPDTAVAENTFEKSLNFAEQQTDLGALGVYLMDGTGNFLPESKRNLPTPLISIQKLLGFGKKYYASHIEPAGTGKVEVLVGAFMLMKKNRYCEVGGFDEDYFMYGEDIDLSYKLTRAGFQNYYFGRTTVLHYKGESTKKDKAYFDRFYGAMEIFYNKHFSTNRFSNNIVSAGVFLAKNFRKVFKVNRQKNLPDFRSGIVISENDNLREVLENKYNLPFRIINSGQPESECEIENSLVVFDAETNSYELIFEKMKKMKGKNNHFRIRPAGSDFIIGSDQSDEKGSAVVF